MSTGFFIFSILPVILGYFKYLPGGIGLSALSRLLCQNGRHFGNHFMLRRNGLFLWHDGFRLFLLLLLCRLRLLLLCRLRLLLLCRLRLLLLYGLLLLLHGLLLLLHGLRLDCRILRWFRV